MQILRTPEPFSPAFGEIRYAVSLTDDEKGGEIGIFNSAVTEKIGVKKAAEAPEFTFHVSDYVRSQVHVEPLPPQGCGLVETPGRLFYSCIAHGEWAASTPHTAGVEAVGRNEPLTVRRSRSLAADEQDEIGWVAAEGTVFARALFPLDGAECVELHLGRAEVSEPRLLALILSAPNLVEWLLQRGYRWEDFPGFVVEIHAGYQLMARFEYRIRPIHPRKTRIAWWNRRGGIDFHTFEHVKNEGRTIEKSTAEIAGRTLVLGAQARRQKTVATARTTCAEAEHLSEIAGAPQVWVVEDGEAVPVETPGGTFVPDDPDRTAFELPLMYSEPIHFQSF